MISFFSLDVKDRGVSLASSFAIHQEHSIDSFAMFYSTYDDSDCSCQSFPTLSERRTNGQTVRARQKQTRINFNVLTIPLGLRHCLVVVMISIFVDLRKSLMKEKEEE